MAKTLEQAIRHQVDLINRHNLPTNWRQNSLNDEYEFKPMPEYGMGHYSVHKETQEVCECKMQWFHDGQILMCPVCFLEGT